MIALCRSLCFDVVLDEDEEAGKIDDGVVLVVGLDKA